MRRMKEHPIMVTELILLFTLMVVVIWIGVSDTDEYALLQGFLFLSNIAVLIVCPFVMLWILERPSKEMRELEKKRKWERSEEYREQFVSRFCQENSFFGPCVFEKDINKNFVNLVEGIKETKFGPYAVIVDIEVSEKCIPAALAELEKLYRNAEDILSQIYPAAMDQCNEWDEKDAAGNPISLDYIRKFYSLDGIMVLDRDDGSIFIELVGAIEGENGEELLGCHAFVTQIECNTGEFTYGLWG